MQDSEMLNATVINLRLQLSRLLLQLINVLLILLL